MFSFVKTIIIKLLQSILGLIIGSACYIGIYYSHGFITKLALGLGLFILIKTWSNTKLLRQVVSQQEDNEIDV